MDLILIKTSYVKHLGHNSIGQKQPEGGHALHEKKHSTSKNESDCIKKYDAVCKNDKRNVFMVSRFIDFTNFNESEHVGIHFRNILVSCDRKIKMQTGQKQWTLEKSTAPMLHLQV